MMKKNLTIVILSIMAAFLIYKVMTPPVVTERKINLQNPTQNENIQIDDTQEKDINFKPNYRPEDFSQEEDDDDFASNFEEFRHPQKQNHNKKYEINISENINSPIRFPKDENIQTQEQQLEKGHKPQNSVFSESFKTCKPYSEEMSSKYMGINIDHKIEILGWINNKCIVNFTSKMTGVDSSFKNIYGIDPSDAILATFVPNIRCEFTKTQLSYVGDSILQEKERNDGATNNMLKDPNKINFPEFENMSKEDLKLLHIVFGAKACKMLNLEDLKKMFNESMDYLY